MDIIDYITQDAGRLRPLAVSSCIPITRLRRLVTNPRQAIRYMTARRLVAASRGIITMDALRARGPMRGEKLFDGPLGQLIADIGSVGRTIPERLAGAGISDDHFREVLLRGRVPSRDRMALYRQAFGPRVLQRHFREHADWRRGQ